jgi:predicted metal-dependent phosphoesterase TrpH
MKLDLHIHSKYSNDGTLDPETIVKIAQERKLDGIAITDHNTIRGGIEALKYETGNLKVIIGAEMMTDVGEVIGLFLTQEINSRSFYEVVEEIKRQGGLVIVPHPFDEFRHSAFHITKEYIKFVDSLEVFNSRCVLKRFNQKAHDFAVLHHLPIVAGSDAHYANEIGLSGIIINSLDVKKSIIDHQTNVFGKGSPLLNHARTKIRKFWGKYI